MVEAVPRYSVGVLDDGNRETVQLQVSLPGEGLAAGTLHRHMPQRLLPPPARSAPPLQPAQPLALTSCSHCKLRCRLPAACRGGGQQRNPVHH
jgi:hypothetical protein